MRTLRSSSALRVLFVVCLAGTIASIGCAGSRRALDSHHRYAYSLLRPAEWIEVRDGQLTVYSNAPEADVQQMVEALSRLRGVLARVTNFRGVDEPPPARIFLFQGPLSYRFFQPSPTTGAYYAPLPGAQTIVAQAGLGETVRARLGRSYRYEVPGLESDSLRMLYHEYIHLMLRNSRALIYPPWYDEGLAEMLSTVRERDGNVEVGIIEHRADPAPIPIVDLISARSYADLSPAQQKSFYARSWGLVHMLVAGHILGLPDRRAAIQRYLVLLNEGYSARSACKEAFGVGPAHLGNELAEYLRSDRIPYLKIPSEEIPTEPADSVRELSEVETLLLLSELSAGMFGLESKLMVALLRAAESVDAEDPRVVAWKSLLLAVAGEALAADAQLARLDGLEDAGDPEVARLEARVQLHLAEIAADAERQERIRLARRRLDAALAAEPGSLESLVLLGRSFLLEPEGEPAPGIAALERARRDMPSNTSVHLGLAELYRRAGEWELARERVDVVLQWSAVDEELVAAREVSAAVAARSGSAAR